MNNTKVGRKEDRKEGGGIVEGRAPRERVGSEGGGCISGWRR